MTDKLKMTGHSTRHGVAAAHCDVYGVRGLVDVAFGQRWQVQHSLGPLREQSLSDVGRETDDL